MKKSPYSKKELSQFQALLKKKLKKSTAKVSDLKSLLKDQKEYIKNTDMSFGSDASKIRNKEMLSQMRNRTQAKIDNIEKAMKKIKKGTYGICEKTGNKISKQRLLAMPQAATCIKMKKKS